MKRYFAEKDSPYNLAIFRIIFFGYLFYFALIAKPYVLWFSHLPVELQSPPVGMKWILTLIPVTPETVGYASILFQIGCFLALIGCFTQISILLAGLTGLYLLGLPQCYGAVTHTHHLVWVMFVLCASKCADVLSVDAMWHRFRGKDCRDVRSTEYAFHLRVIWLLMGLIYFFPGFWKLFSPYGDWMTAEHFKNLLYSRWFEMGRFPPSFLRIDRYGALCELESVLTVLFELSLYFSFCGRVSGFRRFVWAFCSTVSLMCLWELIFFTWSYAVFRSSIGLVC